MTDKDKKKGFGKALAKKFGQEIIPGVKEIHTTGSTALMNPTRLNIFLQVCRTPGINLRALARALDSNPATTMRHMDILEKRGIISSFNHRRRRLFYCPATITLEQAKEIYILAEEDSRQLYQTLRNTPGKISQISRETGVNIQVTYFRLKVLEDLGLAEKQGMINKATDTPYKVKEETIKQKQDAETNVLDILEKENMAPSATRRHKEHMTVEITQGEHRKRITIYLVPQTIP